MTYFDDVFERIKRATSIRTQVDLADVLEIKQSSISDAKKRNSVPAEWLIKLHDKFEINIDWLRWGDGEMYNNTEAGLSGFPIQDTTDIFDIVEPASGLEEEPEEGLLLARGEVQKVLSTFCDYQEGQPLPQFATHSYMQIPAQFYEAGLMVFYMDSSGMEPALCKGAYAGVSPVSPTSGVLVSGEIYAIAMPYEGVVFRRIILDMETGSYLLCFEKKELPGTRLPAEQLRKQLVGKLSWVLQSV